MEVIGKGKTSISDNVAEGADLRTSDGSLVRPQAPKALHATCRHVGLTGYRCSTAQPPLSC